jgi:hypothetical protein
VIANMFDGFVTTLGDLFNSWLSPIAGQAAKGVQDALRSAGFELPVSGTQTGLTAVGGSAMSQPGSLLQLAADVQPVQNVAVQPYVSQVATSSEITTELTNLHVAMRTALNPQPTPPTTPATVTVGTYVGLGLSQNVLNYYVYVQWLQKRFEVVNGDPALIAKLLQVAPPGLFQRVPKQVHLWPASPPRVETTPSGIASGVRPLVVFFDDVRACFELPFLSTGGDNTNVIGGWELSFNLKTTGTITFSWPLVFDVVLDGKATSFAPSDERSWEFADTNVLNVMGQVAPGALEPMVDVLAGLFLSAVSAAPVTAPPAARPWPRPLIAMQQEILKSVPPSALVGAQTFYMEILHRRKALFVLTAADTALMELVDGSGAPTLNAVLVGLAVLAMGSTVTVRTMTCAQGKALAKFLLPLLGLKAGPP